MHTPGPVRVYARCNSSSHHYQSNIQTVQTLVLGNKMSIEGMAYNLQMSLSGDCVAKRDQATHLQEFHTFAVTLPLGFPSWRPPSVISDGMVCPRQ